MCNGAWSVDITHDLIRLLDGADAYDLGIKYKVEQGSCIFQISNEEGMPFYVIAERLSLKII